MRTAYIFNHSYFLGGGEISLYELIRIINKNMVEPLIFVPDQGEIEKKFTAKGMKVIITPFPSLRRFLSGGSLRALLNLINTLKKNRVDLIHVNGSRACFYAGLAGRISGIPVIWHVRETIRDLFLYDGLLGLFADKIICVSKNVKNKRFGRFGFSIKNKISVIYNGVDTERFQRNDLSRQKTRKSLGIDDKEILFGIVGNIIPLKGQDFFIKGLAKAEKDNPGLRVKSLLIGRTLDISFRKRLDRIILDTNLADRVIFLDYTDQINEIFSALDIFVLPSKREGFSRSIIEAMSSGLPVLATRIGEIEEAVRDRENAILVSYDNIDEMASAIIQLSGNENLRRDMGRKNRERAVNLFHINRHAGAIKMIYDQLSKS